MSASAPKNELNGIGAEPELLPTPDAEMGSNTTINPITAGPLPEIP